MKFVHSRDLNVPVEFLFERASDFAAFESRATANGVEVHRLTGGPIDLGCQWQIAGVLRGKPRQAEVELTQISAPDHLTIVGHSAEYRLAVSLNFIALTKRTSRLEVLIEAKGTTLRSRISIQTLRLARGRIANRIKAAITQAAKKVESEFQRQPRAARR